MDNHHAAGAAAYHAGDIRIAPIIQLMALCPNGDAVDAWYEGYDAARGHGPYHGTTAAAIRAAYAASVAG